MAEIVLSKLNKHYGTAHHAVQDLDLVIADQEFIALVGPSGCGKSTTLRMIAGLEDISGGEIRIGGRLVNDLPPKDRDIAMVFQNYALYQHMTVYDNLAFGLRNKKLPEDRVKMEIDRAASILGLQELMQRRPRQLSGGQQQRVALGRCIVRNPQAFLFDEPLSNLDAKLRTRIPTTSVFVTHDQVEAMTLGDRVVVMMDGRIQQVGTPLEVYNAPANKFVASFIGAPAMNFFEVNIVGEGDRVYARTPFFSLPVGPARHRSLAPFAGKSVIAGIRPEHLLLAENGTPDTFEAKVEVIEQLGAEIVLEARAKEAEITVGRVEASTPLQQGQLIRLGAKPGAMQFFEIGSEAAIL